MGNTKCLERVSHCPFHPEASPTTVVSFKMAYSHYLFINKTKFITGAPPSSQPILYSSFQLITLALPTQPGKRSHCGTFSYFLTLNLSQMCFQLLSIFVIPVRDLNIPSGITIATWSWVSGHMPLTSPPWPWRLNYLWQHRSFHAPSPLKVFMVPQHG